MSHLAPSDVAAMLRGRGAQPLGPARTQTTSLKRDWKQARPLHRDSFRNKQLREIYLLMCLEQPIQSNRSRLSCVKLLAA